MENKNRSFQFTIQPNEMAGIVEDDVDECICACVDYCACAGTDECLCFDTEENHANSESDGVEQSGAVEKSGATQEDDATGEDTGIRAHPVVGRYRLEDTSADFLRCGMFALEISTSSQLGTQMTQSEFWCAYDSQEMQDFNKKRGFCNRDLFSDEQLATVLRIWGRHHGRENLQLGVIKEGEDIAYIIGDDDKFALVSSEEELEKERDFTTIWIHNDNVQAHDEVRVNHYSGITIFGRSEEPNDGSEEESSGKEVSGTEKEDDAETRQETGEENLHKVLPDSEEGKSTEDSKGEGSWTLVEKRESKREDSQHRDKRICLLQSP